jgi:hypothetical protein
MALLNFNAANVTPDTGIMDAIPTGWYDAFADQSDIKPVKAGDGGAYLEVRFNITAPAKFAGRKVYSRLNIRNSNPTAQEIGFKQLSALCHAVGQIQVAQSEQLHNLPLKLRIKMKPADGQYEASNDVMAYRNINEQVDLGPAAGNQAAVGAGGFAVPGAVPAAGGFQPNTPPFVQQQPTPPAQQFQQPQQFQQQPQQFQQQPQQFQAPAAQVPPVQAQQPQFAAAPPFQQQQPQQAQQPAQFQQQPQGQQPMQPAGTWTPPPAQQPWETAAVGAPVQQQQQQVQQQQPAQQVQGQPPMPPWMQQPAQ